MLNPSSSGFRITRVEKLDAFLRITILRFRTVRDAFTSRTSPLFLFFSLTFDLVHNFFYLLQCCTASHHHSVQHHGWIGFCVFSYLHSLYLFIFRRGLCPEWATCSLFPPLRRRMCMDMALGEFYAHFTALYLVMLFFMYETISLLS